MVHMCLVFVGDMLVLPMQQTSSVLITVLAYEGVPPIPTHMKKLVMVLPSILRELIWWLDP